MITGPAGGGQQELALLIASARLCEAPAANGLACGRCRACHWLREGSHPDFRWIRSEAEQGENAEARARTASARAPRASREIVIDQIRGLSGFVELASHRGAERVVLIDPADAMNAPAANALLKTLEEPPPSLRFLLTSDRPERLAATIRSRCRRLPVRRPSTEQLRAWLTEVATDASATAIDTAIAASAGAPFAALALLQGPGGAARDRVAEAIAALPESDLLKTAELLAGSDSDPVMRALHAWTVDLGRTKLGAKPIHFVGHVDRLLEVSSRTDLTAIGRFERSLIQQLRWAQHPLNARLLIEDTLLQYIEMFGESARTGGKRAEAAAQSRLRPRGHG